MLYDRLPGFGLQLEKFVLGNLGCYWLEELVEVEQQFLEELRHYMKDAEYHIRMLMGEVPGELRSHLGMIRNKNIMGLDYHKQLLYEILKMMNKTFLYLTSILWSTISATSTYAW